MARRNTAIDTRLPDMVYAAIVQCPVPGGKLANVDDTPLKNAPGIVQVVRLPDAVAVVATDTFWRAKQALAKLHPEWNVGAAGSTDSAQFAKEYRDAALTGTAAVARNDGDVDSAVAAAGAKALSCGLRGAISRACDHGADERDGASAARPPRRLGRHAVGGSHADGRCYRRRSQAGAGLYPQHLHRRRLRP